MGAPDEIELGSATTTTMRAPLPRTFKLDRTVFPPRECLGPDGQGEPCFDRLHERFEDALHQLLANLLTEDAAAPMFVARMPVLRLSRTGIPLGRHVNYRYDIHWRFELFDADGKVVIAEERDTGADPASGASEGATLAAAERKVLDQIRMALMASPAMQR